ncbi:hypothetical protein [Achromobacter marplatensis]
MKHKTELVLLAALAGACTQVEMTPHVWALLGDILKVSAVALAILGTFALLVRLGVAVLIWNYRRKHPEDYKEQ